jgi:hypothetical protein
MRNEKASMQKEMAALKAERDDLADVNSLRQELERMLCKVYPFSGFPSIPPIASYLKSNQQ